MAHVTYYKDKNLRLKYKKLGPMRRGSFHSGNVGHTQDMCTVHIKIFGNRLWPERPESELQLNVNILLFCTKMTHVTLIIARLVSYTFRTTLQQGSGVRLGESGEPGGDRGRGTRATACPSVPLNQTTCQHSLSNIKLVIYLLNSIFGVLTQMRGGSFFNTTS